MSQTKRTLPLAHNWRIDSLPIVLLGISVVATFLASGDVTWRVNTFKQIVFAIGTATALLSALLLNMKVKPARRAINPIGAILPIAVFIAYAALSSLWAVHGYLPLVRVGEIFVLMAFMYMVAERIAFSGGDKSDSVEHIFTFLSGTLLLISLVGLLEYFKIIDFQSGLSAGRRMISTFGNPNYFSGLLVLLVPISYALTIGTIPRRISLFHAACSAVGTGSLALTQSRGGWFGAVAGMLFLMIFSFITLKPVKLLATLPKQQRATIMRWIAIFLITLVLSAVLIPVLMPSVWLRMRTLDFTKRDIGQIIGARQYIWRGAISAWTGRGATALIFGNGSGSFMPLMQIHTPPDFRLGTIERGAYNAHNEYLQILVEHGIVGLCLWLFAVFTALYHGMKVATSTSATGSQKVYAVALMSAIVGALAHGLVGIGLRTVSTRLVFYAAVAGLWAIRAWSDGEFSLKPRNIVIPASLFRLFLLVCVLAISVPMMRSFIAGRHLVHAVQQGRLGNFFGESGTQASPVGSREHLQLAISNNSDEIDARYHGAMMFRLSDQALAYEYLVELEDIVPNYRDAAYFRGLLALEHSAIDDAIGSLLRYAEVDPYRVDTYLSLSSASVMQNDAAAAVGYLADFFTYFHEYRNLRGVTGYAGTVFMIDAESSRDSHTDTTFTVSQNNLQKTIATVIALDASYETKRSLLYFYTATILESAGFGAECVPYYAAGAAKMRSDSSPARHAFDRIRYYYRIKRGEIEAAKDNGQSSRVLVLGRELLVYLDYLNSIKKISNIDDERDTIREMIRNR